MMVDFPDSPAPTTCQQVIASDRKRDKHTQQEHLDRPVICLFIIANLLFNTGVDSGGLLVLRLDLGIHATHGVGSCNDGTSGIYAPTTCDSVSPRNQSLRK